MTSIRTLLARLTALAFSPTGYAIAIKLWGAVASFLVTFIVARTAGAAVIGDYAMAAATSSAASVFAVAGLDQIMTRTIGGDLRDGRRDLARGALVDAARLVLITSCSAAGILLLLSPFATAIGSLPRTIAIAALATLFFPLLRIAVAGLRASGTVIASQFFDGPLHSTLLVLIIGSLTLALGRVTPGVLLVSYAGCICVTCLIAWFALRRRTESWPPRHPTARAIVITAGWPILVAAGAHMLTDWVILAQIGAHLGAAKVGAFRASFQIVTIIALLMTTIESIVNPHYAGDFRIGDLRGAWQRHRRATAMMLLAAGGPVAICLLFPEQLLGLFGPEFLVAAEPLRIMVLAQAANIMAGPIGGLLVMSGRERISLVFAVAGLLLAASVSALLIPRLGLEGAAWGYFAAIVFRNVASYTVGWFKVGKVGIAAALLP